MKNFNTLTLKQVLDNSNTMQIETFNEHSIYKIADVNVAYVKAVIEELKNKQIDQDDRERLNKIEFELKTVPVCENQKIRQLNDDFQFLIKKMTEYDVTV